MFGVMSFESAFVPLEGFYNSVIMHLVRALSVFWRSVKVNSYFRIFLYQTYCSSAIHPYFHGFFSLVSSVTKLLRI